MKRIYEAPVLDIIAAAPFDVITLSLDTEGTGSELDWEEMVTKK